MVIECRWAKYRRTRDVQDTDRLSWKTKLLSIRILNEKNN
jgi:hypothetical protein